MPHKDYIVNGEPWPSATTLTRLLPQDWLWALYQRAVKKDGWRGWQRTKAHSERAMRLGTHTHSLVEAALKGEAEPVCWMFERDETLNVREPERRMKLVRAWAKALVETTSRHAFKALEEKVVNPGKKEHGTVDAIAIDDEVNKAFPKDWKTSGKIGLDYPIQLAIYNRCMEAEGYDVAGYGEIERVDKELKSLKAQASGEHHVQIKRFDNLSQYYPVVDALHVIWDYVNKQGAFKKVVEED